MGVEKETSFIAVEEDEEVEVAESLEDPPLPAPFAAPEPLSSFPLAPPADEVAWGAADMVASAVELKAAAAVAAATAASLEEELFPFSEMISFEDQYGVTRSQKSLSSASLRLSSRLVPEVPPTDPLAEAPTAPLPIKSA